MRKWSDRVSGLIYAYKTLLKSLRHFLTTNRKKTFQRILNLVTILALKEMSNFLVSSSSLKKANTGKPAQNINLSFKLKDSGFTDTFILVFVNENCCLCICVTKLYIFCWLLVVSLVIFNRCAVCFQSFSKHRLQEYSKCLAYQTLLKITHR